MHLLIQIKMSEKIKITRSQNHFRARHSRSESYQLLNQPRRITERFLPASAPRSQEIVRQPRMDQSLEALVLQEVFSSNFDELTMIPEGKAIPVDTTAGALDMPESCINQKNE